MALTDEVQTRYPASLLISLTNPDTNAASSLNTTVLNAAVADVEAQFEITAGIEYDNAEATHVVTACEGVIALLKLRLGQSGETAKKIWDDWQDKLLNLAKITSRDRQIADTTSDLTPSEEVENGVTVRPDFDRAHLRSIAPQQPLLGGNAFGIEDSDL